MTLLLVHCSLLALLSYAAARRLVRHPADRFMAAAMLFWANIVADCLLLSLLGKLNHPDWLFRTSLVLAAATLGLIWRLATEPPPAPLSKEKRSGWLIALALGTLGPMLLANLAIAAYYEPNNYDSQTYHLPRVLYYLGQNSLAHFDTADFRQVYYPFNFNLLQLVSFAYGAPLQAINFFEVMAWVLTGLGVYRISRLGGCSFNASLFAAWLTLTSTEILAQATSTILDLPSAAALLCALAFALLWRESSRPGPAQLAGVAAAMSAGTKLTVAFFGPAGGLLLAVFCYHEWRRGEGRAFLRGVRAWILPGIVAAVLCAPFVLYNLKATGEMMTHRMDFTLNKPFSVDCALQTAKGYLVQLGCEPLGRFSFDLRQITAINAWFDRHVFADWNPAHAFSDLYLIPPDLNEDHVFYGFAGPLLLLCGLVCLARDWRLQRPVTWVALLGLGWFAFYFATNKWSLYNQRYFVPAIAVLGPCAAAVWDARRTGPWFHRLTVNIVFWIVIISGVWFSGFYLIRNRVRPVPLPGLQLASVTNLPELPPALKERLPAQPRVNIYSYGTNERIFPLMHLRPLSGDQRFTSGTRVIDPRKYNLFSFWGNTRNYIYSNLAYFASYTIVPVQGKRTAGIEFLGTVNDNPDPFDYLGWPAHANTTDATPETSNIALLVDYNANTNDPIRIDGARVRVLGLNPRDAAEVRLSAESPDGSTLRLGTFTDADWKFISVKKPFKRLLIQVVSTEDGRNLGLGEIPFTARVNGVAQPLAGGSGTQFAAEFITNEPPRYVSVTGLDQMEGPYAQWDMPRFRWAKQPVVRIVVPADAKRDRLRLTFTVRLHVRAESVLQVRLNGRPVRDFPLHGAATWTTESLELQSGPGENVVELCDYAVEKIPDWFAYLDANPDVKSYVAAQGLPPAEGARQHYETRGRQEGRALPMRWNPAANTPPESLYFAFSHLRLEGYSSK